MSWTTTPTGLKDLVGEVPTSAELKGPRKPSTIRPEICDFGPDFRPKAEPNQAQNIRHGTHKPARNEPE